ncbi:MAG: DUF1704 domain-containing protein [Polyangiaceae bacterium]|nr:DUF1704 domain-containing protein [Polyangiaceae bacterium]
MHIERPLPFLCAYRAPTDGRDEGTADLIRSQASYITASGAPDANPELFALIEGAVGALAEACGACLLLEIWAGPHVPTSPQVFRVSTLHTDELATTVGVLSKALGAMVLPVPHAVEVTTGREVSPPGLPALLSGHLARKGGCLVIGLEVPPLYRGADGVLYPVVLRALSEQLTGALQRGFFEFTRVQTQAKPEHYQVMGRRRLGAAEKSTDRALCRIGNSIDFLLDVTPVNTEAAWDEFRAGGRRKAPTLHYRMLAIDPEIAKRALYSVPLERLEDPVLALLLRDKRRELDLQLSMLEDRDTEGFFATSLRLYGGVDDALFAEAMSILRAVPSDRPAAAAEIRCDAAELARRAEAELAHYRREQPALSAVVAVRDDVPSLVVTRGGLLVPRGVSVRLSRVEALLQHEIGTHIVTRANGRLQPLGVFSSGLADYEALQEGIAVFAEYMAGGFDAERLRLIAARVVGVRRLIERTSFPRLVEELTDGLGFGPRAAFLVAMRVFRGGGLTKDAIYLRGLRNLLAHLASGGAIEPLLIGKVSLERLPLVEELLRRQLLVLPGLTPRWLTIDGAAQRLARARAGLRPVDLIEGDLA